MTASAPLAQKIDFQLKRHARAKRLTIRVRNSQVTVVASKTMSFRAINAFVYAKEHWILDKIEAQKSALKPIKLSEKCISSNEKLTFLGQDLDITIQIVSKKSDEKLECINGLFVFSIQIQQLQQLQIQQPKVQNLLRKLLFEFYQLEATRLLTQKTHHYADQMSLVFTDIRVKRYQSRWGSCNTLGVISYNWLLILAPEFVMDYVVVHELSHLKFMNHSPKFWQLVRDTLPDYQAAKNWLKRPGGLIKY